jgi:FMN phosphatase YigB (HAD superfamily)
MMATATMAQQPAPKTPQYKTRMNYHEYLIEDFQYWYYHDHGHPTEFKIMYVRMLDSEEDLRRKARKLKRRWEGGLPEVLQIPLYTEPHEMRANHNPQGW